MKVVYFKSIFRQTYESDSDADKVRMKMRTKLKVKVITRPGIMRGNI